MGMFDRVWATCPKCKAQVEFQSKAGACELIDYTPASVPIEIALSLENEVIECSNCRTTVGLVPAVSVPSVVEMRVASDEVIDQSTLVETGKPYLCADCGHHQDNFYAPCESCGSMRVVDVKVVIKLAGADYMRCFK